MILQLLHPPNLKQSATYIFLLLLFFTHHLIAQPGDNFSASNPNLDFTEYLNGVRCAAIELSEKDQLHIDTAGSLLVNHLIMYLKNNIGFELVALTSTEKQELYESVSSLCDITYVKVELTATPKNFSNHKMSFTSCLGDQFLFTASDVIANDQLVLENLSGVWATMYNGSIQYNVHHRLQLPTHLTSWTEDQLLRYYEQGRLHPLEGIYEKMMLGAKGKARYRLAVKQNQEGNFDLIYLTGATNYEDWVEGEHLGTLNPSANDNLYTATWYMPDKTLYPDVYLANDQTSMLYFTFANRPEDIHRYLKLFPKNQTRKQENIKATGSGIAISPDGYIITNYHVTEGANYIEVEHLEEGYPVKYRAVVMSRDPNTDLAVLKIDDLTFKGLSDVPFALRTGITEVGENVFTLSYPLTATMGTEVKVTNGIVSSKTGYKGDVATFQVSAAVQPGSSGGPVFDEMGNLIGIIKAKHSKAENATYAIKIRNALNLLELLPDRLILPVINQIDQLLLTDQVKAVSSHVFLVRVIE